MDKGITTGNARTNGKIKILISTFSAGLHSGL